MDKEQLIKDIDELKAKLSEGHALFIEHQDTFQKLGCSLVMSLFMNDKPVYVSAQGTKVSLLQNVIELIDKLKKGVWDTKK